MREKNNNKKLRERERGRSKQDFCQAALHSSDKAFFLSFPIPPPMFNQSPVVSTPTQRKEKKEKKQKTGFVLRRGRN